VTLGYSTNAYTHYPLLDSLAHIADIGFKGVEIMCDQPHLYPPEYDDGKLDEICNALAHHNLKVTNLNSFTLFAVGDTYLPSWIEDDPGQRQTRIQHTRSCLKIAKKLGCGCISIPPGGPLNSIPRDKAMARFFKGLEQVIDLAEELDVRLLVEPEPDLMIERTSEFQAFIQDVQSSAIGINFDIGHFFCAGEDPVAAFKKLYQWVGHVHLEDIGKSRIHQHLVPGDGAIDLESVFKIMAEMGYQGDITLELYPYVNGPDVAGQKSLDHLRPILAEYGYADS
jgi:sugar phosphate isomerase/epimerase